MMIPTPATDPEDLFNTIKRPDRYYRVILSGVYVECVMKQVSDKAYKYWADTGELKLREYVMNPGQYALYSAMPKYADFMALDMIDRGLLDHWSPLHPTYQAWYALAEPLHEYFGGQYDTMQIEVFEVDNLTYFSESIEPNSLVMPVSVTKLVNACKLNYVPRAAVQRLKEIDTNVVSMVETSTRVAYDAFIHTNAKLDTGLLVINTAIQPDGVEIIENIMYNGVILDDENYDVVKHKTNFEVELFQFGKFPGTK